MTLSMIVAMARDGLIGREGGLPWHLPADLKRFRRITMGKPILMGRKTFESIGKPLDGRLNIVLTRRDDLHPKGCRIAPSLIEAIQIARDSGADEAVVLGGAALFREAMPAADRLYLSLVEGDFEGETYFPLALLSRDEWRVIDEEVHPADQHNPHAHRFQVLQRARNDAESFDQDG